MRFALALVALVSLGVLGAVPAAAADPEPPAGRVAWIDLSGELWVGRGDGSEARRLGPGGDVRPIAYRPVQDLPSAFRWPLWAPDGTRLAAFHISEGAAGPATSRLFVLDADSGRIVDSYSREDLRPIYAYWAPDGSRFGFLHQTGPVHTLSLWPAEGRAAPQDVASGLPLFFDWRRDARGLVLHLARDPRSGLRSSVTLLDPESGAQTHRTTSPAAFGPASWSPKGDWLAYGIEDASGKAELVVEKADGSGLRRLGRIDPEAAFSWSPDGKRLAVGKTTDERAPLLTKIDLVEVPSGKTRTLVEETLGCFFWSPRGDRLLYAARDLDRGDWEWLVIETGSKKRRSLGRFLPSPALVFVFQFFDQYALSHRFWSPDGRAFVFTGWTGVDPDVGPVGPPVVHVVEVDGAAAPRPLAPGHVAFWSPK